MQLGDFGADVIKVERPGSGDDTRGWGPPFDERGEAAYFLSVNRNKLSIALDFDDEADRETLRTLARDADVVIENFVAGTLERRAIGADDLLRANAKLVWCTISGFGAESVRPGYDFVVQAEAGWMAVTGEPDGSPMKIGVALADIIAGKDALSAILAALVARGAGALGQEPAARHVHVSLVHSATAALVNVAQNAAVTGVDAKRWGNAHPNLCPYQLFDASDRPIVIAVGTDAQWSACARVLGLDELAGDASLQANAGRLRARERVVRAVSQAVRARPAAHWLHALQSAGVPCGVVKSVREALEVTPASPLTGVQPVRPAVVRRPPPRLDEHGASIRKHGWGVFAHT
jgi:crotonobetainyl-CoA:carnitine CoA-transferase CaiB-like acyl-CoA transferase